MFKIGTLADWFGAGIIDGIRLSQKVGATGVQLYAWDEMNPLTITGDKIEEIKKTADECGQEIVALCGELGGHGLEVAADNERKIDYLKRTVDLAHKLNCRIVTTHIGCIPEDKSAEKYGIMLSACKEVGDYAKSKGAYIAVETGPEPISRLVEFIDESSEGIAINYDPANLVMVTKDDEVNGVRIAGKHIVHTHAKDGIMNKYVGPEKVYEIFAEGGIELLREQSFSTEVRLGEGSVRWAEYLAALKEIGYNGYLTIEREVGENAFDDIKEAVVFLNNIIPTI